MDIWGKKNKFGGNKAQYSTYEKQQVSYVYPKKKEKKDNIEGNTSFKKINDAQYQKIRTLGPYFHYDEKYAYGHVCKNK